ncbi:DUF551 domain-containing protein [Enterobacter kobei]
MSTITKEWLQQKIADMEVVREDIPFGLDEDDSNTLAALRIALASLEAEPVSVIKIDHESSLIKHVKRVVSETYAPPAPVSVPDEIQKLKDGRGFKYVKAGVHYSVNYANGWNQCRAAMLQAGNSPVIPDGWVACSWRMPKKNERVLIFINFNCDSVPPSIHDAQFTGSTFRRGGATVNVFPLEDGYGVTHWMPLPAAPQQ